MNTLRQLIAALPECAPKATLRGIEVAAAQQADPGVRRESMARMAKIVRTWREDLPLLKLEAELEQLLSGADEPVTLDRRPEDEAGVPPQADHRR